MQSEPRGQRHGGEAIARVSLQLVQIFRLLLKISVEGNTPEYTVFLEALPRRSSACLSKVKFLLPVLFPLSFACFLCLLPVLFPLWLFCLCPGSSGFFLPVPWPPTPVTERPAPERGSEGSVQLWGIASRPFG